MTDFDKYYEATEPGYRERAIGWATAIGLQDVDGLKPSKFLVETAKRNIEGEITAKKARELVDAYYEVKGEHDTPDDAEEADKVAARINQIIHTPAFRLSPEFLLGLHGKIFEGVYAHAGKIREVDLTKKAAAIGGLHRRDVVINRDDVVINVVIKLIRGNSQISAAGIAKEVGLSARQVQRLLAGLKKTAGLKRRGSRKTGEWYFES